MPPYSFAFSLSPVSPLLLFSVFLVGISLLFRAVSALFSIYLVLWEPFMIVSLRPPMGNASLCRLFLLGFPRDTRYLLISRFLDGSLNFTAFLEVPARITGNIFPSSSRDHSVMTDKKNTRLKKQFYDEPLTVFTCFSRESLFHY